MSKKITEKRKINFIANSYLVIGVFLVALGTIIIILARYPQVWYAMEINTVENEFATLTSPIEEDIREYRELLRDRGDELEEIDLEEEEEEEEIEDKHEEDKVELEKHTLPKLDFSLPAGNHVYIKKIGVEGRIYEGENPDEVLEKGIWRVNDFGTPEDKNLMILSSHRFGHFSWTQEQRENQSFFHLPSTRVGDKIEIVWNQRKYIYEIYKAQEGERITDYDADLILYTCKLYNSPIRIFRYAQRIN